MENPDFLVIGGGIIGCSLARELARVSRRVTVLDRGLLGAGSTPAAAGLLSPGFGGTLGDPLTELGYQSADLYESWVAELQADGAGDVGFCRPGLIEVWTDPGQEARQRAWHAEHSRLDRPVELLSGDELCRREPALRPGFLGGTLAPDGAQVDPVRLLHGVARVAELAGVAFRENEVIHRLKRAGDRVVAVQTDRTTYQPGQVILCAGAWSGEVTGLLGLPLPTRPVKGQMLATACRVSPVRAPLFVGDALFVPRAGGGLSLGVTVEEAGFDGRVTLDGLRTILDQCCAAVPAVGPLPLARAWAGLRPATPDGWPFMGPLLPLRNLWVSTGHFRKGILLAPLCARLLAQSILAGPLDEDLEPFKPTRRLPE